MGQDLVRVAVAQALVAGQPGEDGGHVVGAPQPAADLAVLGGQRRHLVQPHLVELVGGERQPGVHLDERPVQLVPDGQVPQARPVVGSGPRQQLVPQHVAVAGEGGAQLAGHDLGQLGPPGVEPVPALGPGQVDERVVRQRRGQVAVDLVERAQDVQAGRRAPRGQALAPALGRLGQHVAVAPGAGEGHRRVLRLGGVELGCVDQQIGVDALHLVPGHLGQAQVDASHRVVQLVEQQVAGHGVGLVERAVDRRRLLPQAGPRGPQGLLGLGRQVVHPVVVAVVAHEGGEQWAGLQLGLPVRLGQVGDRVAGHDERRARPGWRPST